MAKLPLYLIKPGGYLLTSGPEYFLCLGKRKILTKVHAQLVGKWQAIVLDYTLLVGKKK